MRGAGEALCFVRGEKIGIHAVQQQSDDAIGPEERAEMCFVAAAEDDDLSAEAQAQRIPFAPLRGRENAPWPPSAAVAGAMRRAAEDDLPRWRCGRSRQARTALRITKENSRAASAWLRGGAPMQAEKILPATLRPPAGARRDDRNADAVLRRVFERLRIVTRVRSVVRTFLG